MKHKKLQSTKAGCKKKKVPSDVTPSTSLPPLVEGQLRCFLRVTVNRVLWISKPPVAAVFRLRWWGESSNGTHFYPRDGSRLEQKGVKTTARFAIRCGPKQFTSYLTDMGTLVLEALSKMDHLPVGRVQIPGIARLSLHHSISGLYTLVSPTTEKLGELQVSLALEPLVEAYGSSSVPAIGTNVDVPVPALGSIPKPVSHSDQRVVLPLSHHLSVGSFKDVRSANSVNTPRGKDHLYFQERTCSQKGVQFSETKPEVLGSLRPLSNRSPNREEGLGYTAVQESLHRPDAGHENSTDILSVLLERGNRLRDAMVVSSLKSDLDSKFVLKDVPKDNVGTLPALPSLTPSGKLLLDAPHRDSSFSYTQRGLLFPEDPSHDWAPDTENRAIELILGSPSVSALPVWDGEGSPPEIFSGASSVSGDSDLGDPQYDQSLLENLFYKAPKLDSSQSEEESTFLRKKQQKKGTSGKEPMTEKLRKPAGKICSGLEEETTEAESIPSLSVEQITFLSQVETARLVIHTLNVPKKAGLSGSKKTDSQGKPLRPFPNRKCTYFVEYLFPVASTKHSSSAPSTKLTRVASSKVAEGVINFHRQCVFPVQFDSSVIKHWWNTDLKFTIYSRKDSEKKPLPVGKAFLPLRSVLLLGIQPSKATALPVLGLEDGEGGRQGEPDLGPLKVSLELEVAKQSSSREPLQPLSIPDRKSALLPKGHSETQLQGATLGQNSQPVASNVQGGMKITPVLGTQREVHRPPSDSPPIGQLHTQAQQNSEDGPGLLLHVLLMVSHGKDLSCGSGRLPNVYLNCKLFASEEATRSAVSWGQTHPTFNFIQVAPVSLTSKLLERLKNNMMVIEVWQKRGGSEQDRPLGLVKLPLHQFYLSFRDPKISQLLLQAQYPVVGVDSYMPVLDISSGSCHGHLRVLLAMGLAEQIATLQRIKDTELCSVSHPIRPPHLLDQTPQPESKVKVSNSQDMMEHVFEVRVQRVKGLMPLQATVWGEADCYVQYCFPAQRENAVWEMDLSFPESGMCLRMFRTATTLCIPDPVFDHTESHVLVAPSAIPVQRLLLGSFCSQGPEARGGMQFEVWCRYYYPNVREQLVAKCLLPLAKLCAMVTMQREEPSDTQVFSLPLVPRMENLTGHQPQPSGLMDICVHYMHRPIREVGAKGGAVAPRVVMLAVQVHRAAGLQAAAQSIAKMDDTFQYYADTGVNSYVTMDISFLPERERRSTRVVAQSFCPEFEHHSEFPCNLVVHKPHGGTCSLAELLDGGTAVFTLRHRHSRRMLEGPAARDTVLGIVTVQLVDLVRKRTGICGWFSLSLPQDSEKLQAHRSAVGGLEISLNFGHHSDRERVMKAARGLGWELDMEGVEEDDDKDDLREGEMWQEKAPILSVAISVPKLWLPLHCLQLPGHQSPKRSTYCYIRYKLYEGKAVCSSLQHPSLEEEPGGSTVATAVFGSGRPVELTVTPALRWYLQEERLELQVWVAFSNHKKPRPHGTDRLIGSAYVDLSSLARSGQRIRTISGVFPLFRRSSANLSGAALRVHIGTMSSGQGASHPQEPDSVVESGDDSSNQGEGSEEEEHHNLPATPHTPRHQEKPEVTSEVPPEALIDTVNTFTASITVERAMHLSLKGCPLADRTGESPSCCVSYSTADATSLVTTPVVESSNCPVWDHRHECRLLKQILVDPQQTLVFKVWHKGDLERVIGFASVDLSPLLAGFQSVCGWYNITDFSGQCQGQLKVSISPRENVQDLRGQRQLAKEDTLKDSTALSEVSPLYCTSAIYKAFPTHISRYPEQRISTSPEQLEEIFSGRSSYDNRHKEHVTNIRMFHESLRAGEGVTYDTGSEDCRPSSSLLFSALRKNLSELDDMQRYFSHKLCAPTFLSQSDCQPQMQRCRDSEGEPDHLQLKSSQLIGKVNSIITNLHGSCPQGSHSLPRDPVLTENQFLPEAESETTQALQLLDAPERIEDETSASLSPLLESDGPEDAPLTVEKAHSNGEEDDQDSVSEEVEEEEYEETVIEPRQLNEISSLTDKTSPWTSLFSDPDLSSMSSLELPEEQSAKVLPQAVLSVAHQEDALESSIQQGGHEGHTCAKSVAEESSAVKTLQLDQPSESEETHSKYMVVRSEEFEKTSVLHVPKHLMHMTDGCQPETQLPEPGKIPNFFLTAEQMEASMRALCLAPVFPSADSDTAETRARPGISSRRAPRPRPSISSLKKEETKRIAKIFASKFSDLK
ncbi:C2 domain-containing protein 3 isoform X2 [Brienomyrus brachyistius]|uniref:C2 domain-containing protein 3 isoform X2 n=1 Tax=Brienomyrus brachyistius TaxID=42636 RepID=UPI0020B17B2C|nr:C2 domain-containing protein 3 isoform X2 [Brienomyrus brachyistius]